VEGVRWRDEIGYSRERRRAAHPYAQDSSGVSSSTVVEVVVEVGFEDHTRSVLVGEALSSRATATSTCIQGRWCVGYLYITHTLHTSGHRRRRERRCRVCCCCWSTIRYDVELIVGVSIYGHVNL
jgi:hypothetical protein